MLSNRVAAKRAYHRRVERMEGLQKENNFLEQVLAERQQRLKQLEALVRAPILPFATGCRLAEPVSPYRCRYKSSGCRTRSGRPALQGRNLKVRHRHKQRPRTAWSPLRKPWSRRTRT